LIPVARKLDLLAKPGEHRMHEQPTPLVGGIAIFLSMAASALFFSVQVPENLFLGMFLLMGFGIIDDRWTIPFWIRFVVQIAAALLVIRGGVVLNDLGYLMSDELFTLGRWEIPLTVFAIVGVINAINMIDGLDGLAGVMLLVAISVILFWFQDTLSENRIQLLLVMVSALAGFLVFNIRFLRPARVFLGDSGSMSLGLFVAWIFVADSQAPVRLFPPVASLWILMIPLFDTVGVMLRRILRGHSPFHADRLHTHHLLLAMGMSVNGVLVLLGGSAIVMAFTGLWAVSAGVAESTLFLIFLGLFAFYVLLVETGERVFGK
jgi:UDP-GlcNAc:undecaprenyl-phosphate GlcNAc-1-phosphate transferase